MSLSNSNVIKLPFSKSSTAENSAEEHTPEERHALVMLDIDYKYHFDDYVTDMARSYSIPLSDAERLINDAFILARNNVSTFARGVPAHLYIEKYITEAHELYSQCSKHLKNELEDTLANERLNEAIKSVTQALIGKGLSREQSLKRLTDFLLHLSDDEKIALIAGTPDEADMEHYDRIITIMSHPGPRIVVDNPENAANRDDLETAQPAVI